MKQPELFAVLQRPEYWSSVHDAALARLTAEWQRLPTLRTPEVPGEAFRDLRDWGAAEERTETLLSDAGAPRGQFIFYRLAGYNAPARLAVGETPTAGCPMV